MPRFLSPLCVAAVVLAGCGPFIQPFSKDDPRIGRYNGAFTGCQEYPGSAFIDITKEGYSYFDTALNSYIESGSPPGHLVTGGRQVRFDYAKNSLGTVVRYSVDGVLSEDGQVISGTFKATSSREGTQPVTCQFSVRRLTSDPRYVSTTPGNFACAGGVELDTRLFGPTGSSILKLSGTAPRPSCFSGGVSAVRLRPTVSYRFWLGAETGSGVAGEDNTRPMAVWSACDGRELACAPPRAQGFIPYIPVDLKQFEDVLLLVQGEGGVSFEVSAFPSYSPF
ncbi:MAG TPA: hypothetical protein VK447_04615 [Myxococcaceae bacterium]|nr:hypothetical protein [Myxococcaceae bacterium]